MSWAPNETAAQLWNERCIFIGQLIGAIGYGVHLTLFCQCVPALCARKFGRRNRELLIFVFILFALGNIGNATSFLFAQKSFINNRDYPGGPGAYFVEQSTDWSAVDGILARQLYRFWAIWSRNYYIAVVLALAFLTSITDMKLAIPYWVISISMTVILTALIAGRLLFMRYRLDKLVGARTSTPYVTVMAMLVESAAFIPSMVSPSSSATSIAPLALLIILRVARGQTWCGGTADQLITIQLGKRIPATRTTNAGSTTVLDTFHSGPTNGRVGSHQDLEHKQDGGESEPEFRAAVV
ncbi:hypothetical protein B0H14DRAFT_3127513 [Mycena olivaceomarginata]|nr:hypothetical protein B0H14DRAFT_3127513 [Mycena olivaceomarginata]